MANEQRIEERKEFLKQYLHESSHEIFLQYLFSMKQIDAADGMAVMFNYLTMTVARTIGIAARNKEQYREFVEMFCKNLVEYEDVIVFDGITYFDNLEVENE